MNAMIQFKSNVLGNHSPTSSQRTEALKEMYSMYQARRKGILQNYLEKVLGSNGAKSLSLAKSAETSTKENDTNATATSSNKLSSDTFLQLLVMQMQYQDPLEPVQNTDMLAQLAQFSALEQSIQTNAGIENLQKDIQALTKNVQYMSLSASQQMIGKYIEGSLSDGTPVKGKVESVSIENDSVILNVGSNKVPLTNVQNVRIE